MENLNRRKFLGLVGSAAVFPAISFLPEAHAAEKKGNQDFSPNTPEGKIEGELSKLSDEGRKTYDHLVKTFSEILNDENERKELLSDLAGKFITMGANAPHLKSLSGFLYSMISVELEDTPIFPNAQDRISEKQEVRSLELTDVMHHREQNTEAGPTLAAYQNVGVAHAGGKYWEAQKEKIYQAIEEADVVLLERGDSWFPQLKRYIQSLPKIKQVQYLEGDAGMKVAGMANVLGLLCVADMLSLNPLKQAERGVWTHELAKAWIYQQIGTSPASVDISQKLTASSKEPNAYSGQWAFDYVGDARTVWMWLAIQKARRENPDKNILSITGDYHAKGFEYYDKHAGEKEFKRGLYNAVFFLHKMADEATKRKR